MINGLAKKQFYETYQRLPWKSHRQSQSSTFQLLDQFLMKGRLSNLDYALAKRLLRDSPDVKEEAAFFICHLILAAKEGHLCVKIEHTHIEPKASQIWQAEGEPFSREEMEELEALIHRGANAIPSHLISDVVKESDRWPSTPFCRYCQFIYLQRHWVFETIFLKQFRRQKRQGVL